MWRIEVELINVNLLWPKKTEVVEIMGWWKRVEVLALQETLSPKGWSPVLAGFQVFHTTNGLLGPGEQA